MKTVAFHTLGCKVNQYDTQAMLEKFRAAGYEVVPFDAAADVYVINTCTVTGTGDKKSMQLTRRLRREHPESHIILAGCLAQRKGEELLEAVCRGRGFLMKGGVCDYDRCCAVVLDEFRAGKLGRITLETPQKPKPRLVIPGAAEKAVPQEENHGED